MNMTLKPNIIGLLLGATLLAANTTAIANTTANEATASTKPKAGFSACVAINEKERKIFASSTFASDDGLRDIHGEQFAKDKYLNMPGLYDQGVPKTLVLTCKWAKTEAEVREYIKGIEASAKQKNMGFLGLSWSPNDRPANKK
jgi:hypothetical protein